MFDKQPKHCGRTQRRVERIARSNRHRYPKTAGPLRTDNASPDQPDRPHASKTSKPFPATSRRYTLTQSEQPADTGTLTDAATISEQIREHQLLQQKLHREIALLGEEHSEQWAGMGPDQALVFADSLDEIVAKLKPSGNDDRTIVVEYITAEPPVLIV